MHQNPPDFIPRLLLTPGEPAGIGPDVVIQLAQQSWPAQLIVIADPDLMQERAKLLNLPLSLIDFNPNMPSTPQTAGSLTLLSVKQAEKSQPGILNPANASYVIQTLEVAASLCEQKKANAIVTGPVNKNVINQSGIAFRGHTEFFANHAHVEQTVMLFVVNQLKIAIATTHLPLSEVSKAITKERLRSTLSVLHQGLKKQFHLTSPKISVCGLNPHAGEGGYLGREEIDVMIPLMNQLREEGFNLTGPLSADTIFTPKHLAEADAILAMYHDQALPLVKYIGFGHAVNVTLGLPYVRTSVDHGTAIDLAGTGKSDAGSMIAAVKLAWGHVSDAL